MNNNPNSDKINSIIESQSSFGVCLLDKPTIDTVAAATALYLGLTKIGKDVSVVCSGTLPETSLIASDKITKTLGAGGDTLIVSFPYTEGSIDKVSYHIEGDRFNLLIQPRAGYDKLATNQVNYNYTGGQVQVMITLDAPTLQSLGDVYTQNEAQFKGKDIINIDRHLTNANFGSINMVERQASSTSEIVFRLLQSLQIEIDKDMATNLYAGIVAATANFTSFSVNANTFDVCAQLLKMGAVKKTMSRPVSNNSRPTYSQNNPQNQPQNRPSMNNLRQRPVQSQNRLQVQNQPLQRQNVPLSNGHQAPSQEQLMPVQEMIERKDARHDEESPDDWLKPKIFNGSDGSQH